MSSNASRCYFVLLITAFVLSTNAAQAADPLHEKIDLLIETQLGDAIIAPTAADSTFLRRVYLDFAGRIPTSEEARAFLGSEDEDRRAQLIDRLLIGIDYPRRMQELFHVVLLERRGDNESWQKFLRTCFEKNQPWDTIVRSILDPSVEDKDRHGAAFFLTQRLVKEGAMAPVDVPGLTRDVGRLFAGVDLQCAQCHDHLSISDYGQADFQGLNYIFENIKARSDVQFPAVSEGVLTGPKEYQSVFDPTGMKTGLRIPGGPEVAIRKFETDQQYVVEPDRKKKIAGVPRFSPLTELATRLASEENSLFSRNISNRLWFLMMGRGLVEPLDLHHSENQPSHPEILDLLSREFAAHQFDIRWLLKELALTRVYQRSGQLPEGTGSADRRDYRVAMEKRVSAEQLFWSIGVATGEFEAIRHQLIETQKQMDAPNDSIDKIRSASHEQILEMSETLQAGLKEFRATFGNPPREAEVEFAPTVKSALYMMHQSRIQEWLKPRPHNLASRLRNESDDKAMLEELFLSLFSRPPAEDESEMWLAFLSRHTGRRDAVIQNLMWAMLASTEFVVNH